MEFTIEQLENIIGGATDNSVWFRPISNCYYDKDFYRVDVIGVSLMPYYYSTCSKLADLQKSLQEMKMKEEAKDVDFKNGDVVYWDGEGMPEFKQIVADKDGLLYEYYGLNSGRLVGKSYHEFGLRAHNKDFVSIVDGGIFKPLTPEQKQAQIDEKNGELFYNLTKDAANKVSSNGNRFDGFQALWHGVSNLQKAIHTEIAKQIDFPGKLSA